MASNIKAYIKGNRPVRTVGYISSWHEVRSITNGAVAEVDMDNYTICEVAYTAAGAKAKKVTAGTTKNNMYLLATPEETLDIFGEKICDFYNGKDEHCTPVYLDRGITFATSGFTGALVVGDLVKFDATTQKFVKTTVVDEAMFQVIEVEVDDAYVINGLDLVELRVL